jgi:peptidase E
MNAQQDARLLLLSSSSTPAGYLTEYLGDIREFVTGVRRAVFVPFAAVRLPWNEYAKKVAEAIGFPLLSIDHLDKAELIVVGGGNTFQLLRECRTRGLLDKLRASVAEGRAKYLGWSAGANLACPTIRTTNDMPIVDPGGLGALGLVRFQINPHYQSALCQRGAARPSRRNARPAARRVRVRQSAAGDRAAGRRVAARPRPRRGAARPACGDGVRGRGAAVAHRAGNRAAANRRQAVANRF